ncbi:MAG: hypothetical protein IT530_04760 [Burkholderiales bacterium]|nr:hypothetical protein [Burkholderiales bacterium]
MPVLKTYTATIGPAPAGGGRRASAEDFGASAGLANAGKAVQDFGERMLDQKEQEESRKALITSTELRAKYARELDEAALSGGDTAALKEKMAADFAKIGEAFETKRGSESVAYYAANSELMFDEQANRIEVQRADANARLEGNKFLMDASRVLQSNENYLPIAEASVDGFLATYTKLRPEQRAVLAAELKQQLNLSAALGVARVNPERALKEREAGRWDLKPQDRERAREHAEQEIRARRTQEAVEEARAEKQKRERSEKAWDRHIQALDAGTFSASAVARDPDMEPQQKIAMQNFATTYSRSLIEQSKPSNPDVKLDLFLRAIAPDTDPRKLRSDLEIVEAANRRDLNIADTTMLRRIVVEQRDEANVPFIRKADNLLRLVQNTLNSNVQYQVQPGKIAEIAYTFRERIMELREEYMAAGKSPNDLFNPKDPNSVISAAFLQGVIAQVEGRAIATNAAGLPVVKTIEERDALPKGTVYIGPDGKEGVAQGSKTEAAAPAAQEPFEPPRPVEAVGRAVGGVVERLRSATPRESLPPIRRRPERLPGED